MVLGSETAVRRTKERRTGRASCSYPNFCRRMEMGRLGLPYSKWERVSQLCRSVGVDFRILSCDYVQCFFDGRSSYFHIRNFMLCNSLYRLAYFVFNFIQSRHGPHWFHSISGDHCTCINLRLLLEKETRSPSKGIQE